MWRIDLWSTREGLRTEAYWNAAPLDLTSDELTNAMHSAMAPSAHLEHDAAAAIPAKMAFWAPMHRHSILPLTDKR